MSKKNQWKGQKLYPKGKEYLKVYPIDFDLIDYGDTVPNSVLVDYYGVPEEDENFKFKQIQFVQFIDRELRSRGKVCTICIRDGQIRILTHEEAAIYNRKKFNCHISGMAKTHEKNIHVEREYLTFNEQEKHDRTVMFQSKVLQSVLSTRAEFQLQMAERKTPGYIEIKALDSVVIPNEK